MGSHLRSVSRAPADTAANHCQCHPVRQPDADSRQSRDGISVAGSAGPSLDWPFAGLLRVDGSSTAGRLVTKRSINFVAVTPTHFATPLFRGEYWQGSWAGIRWMHSCFMGPFVTSNRRHGSRISQEMREMKEELAAKFQEPDAKTVTADHADEEVLGGTDSKKQTEELPGVLSSSGDMRRRPGYTTHAQPRTARRSWRNSCNEDDDECVSGDLFQASSSR